MLNKLKQGHWPIFLLSSLSSIANLFLPIFLVRLISPEQMGHYKIFFLHLSALPFLFLTGGPINSVYYWVGKEASEKKKYIQACFQLSLLLSFLILVIGVPFHSYFSQMLNIPSEYFLFMIFAAFFWVPGSHFGESSIATGFTAKGSIYATSFEILKVIVFISIALLTKDLLLIFASYTAILSIKFILTIYLGKKQDYINFNFDKERIKDVFMYCLPISISGLLGFFVDKVDLLILSGFLDPEAFAFYSMGCLVIPPLLLLDMSVQKVLIPKLSSSYNNNENSIALEYFQKAISDVAFIIIPAIFGLYFFAKPIVELLYTDQYLESSLYLKIFAISYLLYIIPHDAIPRATGKTGWILKIYLITTPISLIGVFLLAKYSGAQYALLVAIALKFLPKIAGLQFSAKIMNWKLRDMIPWGRLSIYAGMSLALSLICLSIQSFFPNDQYWFFICSPLFAIIYLGSLYVKFRK